MLEDNSFFSGMVKRNYIPEIAIQQKDFDVGYKVVLGIDVDNKVPIVVDFRRPMRFLMGGRSGGGKTNGAKVFLTQLAHKKNMKVIVLNDTDSEFSQCLSPAPEHPMHRLFRIKPEGINVEALVPLAIYKEMKNKPVHYRPFLINGNDLSEDVWLEIMNITPDTPLAIVFSNLLDVCEDKNTTALLRDIRDDTEITAKQKAALESRMRRVKKYGVIGGDGDDHILDLDDLITNGRVSTFDTSEIAEEQVVRAISAVVVYAIHERLKRMKGLRCCFIVEEAQDLMSGVSKKAIITYARQARKRGGSILYIVQTISGVATSILLRSNLDSAIVFGTNTSTEIDDLKKSRGLAFRDDLLERLPKQRPGEALFMERERAAWVKVMPSPSQHISGGS